MKIVVVRGNPRKSGVCQKLADIFAEGLKSGGGDVVDIDLCALKILPCRGCFACSAGENGVCVIDDDMARVRAAVSAADAIVCVSPVYFYAMSSQMKCFFDRCFPFVRGYSFDSEKKRVVNETNFSVKDKKFVTISVASGRLTGSFEAMSHTYSVIADALGFEYTADLRRAESPYFGILGERAVRMRKILGAFRDAGREFASRGTISPALKEVAELQFTESDEAFATNSKIFWQLRKNGGIGSKFSDNMRFDPRIILEEMRKGFLPENAPASARIKFTFADKNYSKCMAFSNGKCNLEDGAGKCDLSVRTDISTWVAMMSRRADVGRLLREGKIVLEGDKTLFIGLKKFFKLEEY